MQLFEIYEPFLLRVISDVRYPRGVRLDDDAGVTFPKQVKHERFDIPLLLTSSDPSNAARAGAIPARFAHKLSPTLHEEVHAFFMEELGFGDFVFRRPNGEVIARAANLRTLEKLMGEVP